MTIYQIRKPAFKWLLLTAVIGSIAVAGCNDNTELVDIVEDGEAGVVSLKASSDVTTLAVGQTFTLSTIARYDDGTESNLGDAVRWVSRNEDVATVNSDGVVTAVAAGDASIVYHWRRISGSTQVQVTSAELASIELSTDAIEANECSQTTVTAAGLYTDGSSQPLSATSLWSSNDEAVARILSQDSEQASLLLATSGNAEISLSSGQLTATLPVTVIEALNEISFNTSELILDTDSEQPLQTSGIFSDGTETNIDAIATFTLQSDDEENPPVDAPDAIQLDSPPTNGPASEGSAENGSTVDSSVVDSSIEDGSAVENPAQSPTGESSEESSTQGGSAEADQAKIAEIILATSIVADIVQLQDSSIVVRAKQAGSLNLSASCGGQSADVLLTVVDPPVLFTISFDTSEADIEPGDELTLPLNATYSDGSQNTVTDSVEWSILSGATDSFELDPETGLLTANPDIVLEQSVIIEASYETASAEIEVFANRGIREEVVDTQLYYVDALGETLPLTDANASLIEGETLQLKLMSIYNTGREEFAVDDLFWSNLNPQLASINGTGLLTAHAAGISTIFAVRQNEIATFQFSIEAAPVTDPDPTDPDPTDADPTN